MLCSYQASHQHRTKQQQRHKLSFRDPRNRRIFKNLSDEVARLPDFGVETGTELANLQDWQIRILEKQIGSARKLRELARMLYNGARNKNDSENFAKYLSDVCRKKICFAAFCGCEMENV